MDKGQDQSVGPTAFSSQFVPRPSPATAGVLSEWMSERVRFMSTCRPSSAPLFLLALPGEACKLRWLRGLCPLVLTPGPCWHAGLPLSSNLPTELLLPLLGEQLPSQYSLAQTSAPGMKSGWPGLLDGTHFLNLMSPTPPCSLVFYNYFFFSPILFIFSLS